MLFSFKTQKAACRAALLALLAAAATSKSSAQNVVGSAAGGGLLNGQFHAFSIGEMALVSTEAGPSLVVTQGFLQPAETTVGAAEPSQPFFSQLDIFPNPTASMLTVRGAVEVADGPIWLRLFDVRGVLLFEKIATKSLESGLFETQIDLAAQPVGTYFLTIQSTEKSSTFKISKS